LVTGNAGLDFYPDNSRITVSGIRYFQGKGRLSRVIRNVYLQSRLALLIAERTRFVDTWIFFIGGNGLIMPMLMARLTWKSVFLVLSGSDEESLQSEDFRFFRLVSILSNIGR